MSEEKERFLWWLAAATVASIFVVGVVVGAVLF